MSEFRLTSNGYVDSALTDADLAAIFRNLKALNVASFSNFELLEKSHLAIEVIREIKRLLGGHGNFREWLGVNFSGGAGPLQDLVRDIGHYLNGRIGHTQLITSISVHENRLKMARTAPVLTPGIRSGGSEPFLKKGDEIYDYDLYRLMAGISPNNVGRIFLLLGGETYYG